MASRVDYLRTAGAIATKKAEPISRERLLTEGEAADFLRCSRSFLAKGRMEGSGPPFIKVGRSIRYRESDLLQWMKSHTHLSTSE